MPTILDRSGVPEFRQDFSGTRYPFSSSATLSNAAGYFLPETVFSDAIIHAQGLLPGAYLAAVVIVRSKITIWVGDSGSTRRASGEFSSAALPANVPLFDSQDRPAGLLISSATDLSVFQTWEPGTHEFEPEATQFAASCCVPTPEQGVRGVLLDDGTLLTGDVWLVGGDGVVLSHEQRSPAQECQNGSTPLEVLRIDIVGDPLYRRRLCQGAGLFSTPRYLQKIIVTDGDQETIITPDDYGQVRWLVGNVENPTTALRLRQTDDGLLLEALGSSIAG